MQKKILAKMIDDIVKVNHSKKSIYYSMKVVENYSNGIANPLKILNTYLEKNGIRYFLLPHDSKKLKIVQY